MQQLKKRCYSRWNEKDTGNGILLRRTEKRQNTQRGRRDREKCVLRCQDLCIEIPQSVTKIDEETFENNKKWNKIKLLIRCVTGTEAHRFAVRNEYDWEPMNP